MSGDDRGRPALTIYYSNMGSNDFGDGFVINGETRKIPILVSFYNLKKDYVKPKWVDPLMLDSGAFSAWRLKTSVVLDDYIAYCHEKQAMYDVMIGLDVVNNPERSMKNFLIMKAEGLNVMPVYHIAEPFSFLKRYADKADYIGIGGIAWADKGTKRAILRKIFQNWPDSRKTGFHGLGVHDEKMMTDFPWRSVDARTAHILARFGMIATPKGVMRLNPNHPKDGVKRIEWQRGAFQLKKKEIYKYLESIGADIKLAEEESVAGKVERCRINVVFYENLRLKCPEVYTGTRTLIDFEE